MTEQEYRAEVERVLDKTVVVIDEVNDAPFGVLLQQVSGKVWRGTDGKLYIVKGGVA